MSKESLDSGLDWDLTRKASPMTDKPKCPHDSIKVEFDEETANREKLSDTEIRRRWPRFYGKCPDCGQMLIKYASMAHYVYGDW